MSFLNKPFAYHFSPELLKTNISKQTIKSKNSRNSEATGRYMERTGGSRDKQARFLI